MKPVAIFRHSETEGPGSFVASLDRRGIPWRLIKLDAGEPVPETPDEFGGLVFMGGPMSVNDDLPWIDPVLNLIRSAVNADVPVLGHCLGGQLMSKALGGKVGRNPVKEIGWGKVEVLPNSRAQYWFGHAAPTFDSFHWHGETFAIPPGGERILANQFCENQAFGIGDKHLAMQCHIEMTAEMIDVWCESGASSIARSKSPAVQPVPVIKAEVGTKLPALNQVADGVYAQWIKGLKG